MRNLDARAVLCMAALAATTGCRGAPPENAGQEPPRSLVMGMIGTPVFRPSNRVAQTTTDQTIETVFRTQVAPDSVAKWYRSRLLQAGWEIRGDARMPDGSIALHAVHSDRPPLWVTIRRGDAEGSTEYSVIGAAPDTTDQAH